MYWPSFPEAPTMQTFMILVLPAYTVNVTALR
jgi:hypothetical protein